MSQQDKNLDAMQDAKNEAIAAGSQALPVGEKAMHNIEDDQKEQAIDAANGLKPNEFDPA